MLQLFLWNGNSARSLDFAYSVLLCYILGIRAKIICLKTFMLHLLWVSLGSPRPFRSGGVVGPKLFLVAQHALSTHCKTAVDTECLQIRGLCCYSSRGTSGMVIDYLCLPLSYTLEITFGFLGLLGLPVVFISLVKVNIKNIFKRDIIYPLFCIFWVCFYLYFEPYTYQQGPTNHMTLHLWVGIKPNKSNCKSIKLIEECNISEVFN